MSRNHSNGGAALRDRGERRSARFDWIIGCQARNARSKPTRAGAPSTIPGAMRSAGCAGCGRRRETLRKRSSPSRAHRHPRRISVHARVWPVGRSMGRPSFGQRGDNTLSRILTHSVLRSRRVTRRPTVAGWQMAPGDDRDGGGGGQYGHATVIK